MWQYRSNHHAETKADRLVRLRRWCVTGQLAAAELELHEWRREQACPAQAAVLLSRLTSQRGDHAAALDELEAFERQRHTRDVGILQALIVLCWQCDQHDRAAHWFAQLREHAGHLHNAQQWMQAMDEYQSQHRSQIDPKVEQLAVELMDHLTVVPSLVAAMKLQPDIESIAALRAGLTHAYRDIHGTRQQVLACEALAELALLAGDRRDARRWAHRGRRMDAYHARFALILADLEDDAAVGPPATAALSEALRAHPNYPDVRAALIRREFADGQVTVARRRLKVWLHDQPQHPLALKLEQEIAA